MNKMNPEIKAQWVAALRSGEYEQGQEALNQGGKFCCLGVLTDLAVKAGVCEWTESESYGRGVAYESAFGLGVETAGTPEPVREWAGYENSSPMVDLPHGSRKSVADLNDSGTDFFTIADFIEEQL